MTEMTDAEQALGVTEKQLEAEAAHAEAAKFSSPVVNSLVDRWFTDSFLGTRLGNDTASWNLVYTATQDLKRRLATLP
ncbi:hypothetical protein [Methylovirgula sp. HY1]|uniref:hypothetical protein n=1 Tax=Methylovirgula sp. HY1 TaxID=2822761 RepID=UPI001C5BD4F2|nr:hypothetical protein [Methylovirgula sp. HY1]QXX74238.1 hypothetical protein MHY1_01048 [Methylovirgula sp. HY1]